MRAPTDHEIERFSAYIDGELSDEQARALEHELAHDAELQAAFDTFTATLGALGSLGTLGTLAVPAEVDLRAGVERKLRRRSRGRYFSDRSVHRQRAQTASFIGVAVIVLAVVALVASPDHIGELLMDPLNESESVERGPALPIPSAPNEPPPELEDASIERGAVVPPSVREMRFEDRAYVFRTALSAEAARAAIVEHLGDVEIVETEFDARAALAITVPRADRVQLVGRLRELGAVQTTTMQGTQGDRAVIYVLPDSAP